MMKHAKLSFAIAFGLTQISVAQAQITTTTVEQGALKGAPDGKVMAFLGIPYAAPPVEDLRWRAPQPATGWQGIRTADRFGANCQQDVIPGGKGFGAWTPEYLINGPVSENCLFLNIWTPAKKADAKTPVFVWIHGGGFSQGSGDVPIYNGAAMAARGVVVVSINYRLGLYGFMAHPDLAREQGDDFGNYGLRDQIAALKWVQKNISAFGGDPARVTIAGQSAGAASVHDLILSPLAKGLFNQAIAQSGSGMGIDLAPLAQAEETGLKLQQAANAESLAALRRMSPEQLGAASHKIAGASPLEGLRFAPYADGFVLPTNAEEALASGAINDTPIITGLTADEGSSMSPDYRSTDRAAYIAMLQKRYGSEADRLAKLYPATAPARSGPEISRDRGIAAMLLWAEQRMKTGQYPIYGYLFSHVEPGPDAEKYGAFHSGELAYVFDTLDKSPNRPFTKIDYQVADAIQQYWVNFVKTGNPNDGKLPNWPHLAEDKHILDFKDTPTVRPALAPDKMEAFRAHVKNGGQLGIF